MRETLNLPFLPLTIFTQIPPEVRTPFRRLAITGSYTHVSNKKMSQIVCAVPEGFDSERWEMMAVQVRDENFERVPLKYFKDVVYKVLDFCICNVKKMKTDEEKKASRAVYRKDYAVRPHVLAKQKARLEDPKEKKRRAEYSAKEEVKQAKREKSKKGRIITRLLKTKCPKFYEELLEKADKEEV